MLMVAVVCRTVFYGSRYSTGVSHAEPWRVESATKTAGDIWPTTVTVRCATLVLEWTTDNQFFNTAKGRQELQ